MKAVSDNLQGHNIIAKKHLIFLCSLWALNLSAILYLFFHNIERYKAVSACKEGKLPPAYYKWKEVIEGSGYSAISSPDFCASILYVTPGLIVLWFYLTALTFLSYGVVVLLKNGISHTKEPIVLFLSGIFFLTVPYIYDALLPN